MIVKRMVVLSLFIVAFAAGAPAGDDGFIQLFNGEDLSNWQNADGGKPSAGWVVEDRALVRKPGAGMIWSKERFGNFVLDLEFKTEGNSGIFFRTDNPKDCVQTGFEMQGYRPVEKPGKHSCGAIYDALAPSKEMTRDGQWNHVTITAVDNRISIVLNGEQIIDMDLNRWTEPGRNPDGSNNKFRTALKDFKREGHIGLQDHGAPVWYRNIRVKPLGAGTGRVFTLAPDSLGMVLKAPDGRTVFRYMTKKPAETKLTANSVCCLYPLNTPSGERVVDFAPSDHPHHRGLFLAWHSISAREARQKADFWGWGAWAPTEGRLIKNSSVKLLQADSQHARLRVANDWLVGNVKMIDEILFVVARQEDSAYVIDLNFHLTPAMDVTLDKTAFGGLCAKGRKDGIGSYFSPGGLVKLPEPHHLKPESDWPAADWYDYTIKLNSGKTVGVAVLDHPANPPTAWHNLGPIAMVNPCIVAPGAVAIKKGQTLNLRYRIVAHDGPTPMELLKTLTSEWRGQENPRPFKLEPGFTRLENGKDLTGWFAARWSGQKTGDRRGWSIVDGAIHLDFETATSHLFNEKKYGKNVIIRLQFRAARAADSGLCIHGKQFQVRDYVNSLPDTGKYAPFCNPPGQWNNLEFDISDGIAVIKLNGQVIEEAWETGTAPDVGLGLQRELGDFDFRYVRLKEKNR